MRNLKIRLDHLLMLAGALVLGVGAIVVWRVAIPEVERRQLDDKLDELGDARGTERSSDKSSAGRRRSPWLRPTTGSRGFGEAGYEQGVGEVAPAPEVDPGQLDADAAVAAFQGALDALEQAADSDGILTPRERRELYNRATGSFMAMSTWINGRDPDERAVLEDAYLHMKVLLQELDLEGLPAPGSEANGRRVEPYFAPN